MATRGVYGFRQNEKDKLAYAPTGAYPSVLGRKILSYLSKKSLDDLVCVSKELKLVNEDEDKNSTGNFLDDLDNEGLVDAKDFIFDSICEWGWVINLDNQNLEVYSSSPHFNYDPKGRYVVSSNPPKYKGAVLVHEIPLKIIFPDSVDYHVQAIKTSGDNLFHISNLIELRQNSEKLQKKLGTIKPLVKLGKLFIGTKG